jgi:hypothetical protein
MGRWEIPQTVRNAVGAEVKIPTGVVRGFAADRM